MNKKWYFSKTVWVNVLATVAILIQSITGKDILPPETQIIILSFANLVLRAITKENIVW